MKKLKKIYFLSSLFSFLAALFSKEAAFIFPFLLLAYNFTFLKKTAGFLKLAIPYFVLALAFFWFRTNFVSSTIPYLGVYSVTNLFKIAAFYLRLLILPFNLHMQHNLSESRLLVNLPFLASVLIVLGIFFVCWKYADCNYLKFGLIWFIIALLPFTGILNLGSDIAEQWLYLPLVGLAIYIAGLINKRNNKMLRTISIIFLCFFAILTIRQNSYWQDDLTLYRYTLKYQKYDPDLYYNLGNAYLRRYEFEKAKQAYLKAIELKPDYAWAWNNLGLAAERAGNLKEAYRAYLKAFKFDASSEVTADNLKRLKFSSLAFAQESEFTHELYQQILDNYLKNGRVNYRGLKNHSQLLATYLKELAELDKVRFRRMSREEKLAIYINAYNAFTIKAIIDHYPVGSIRDIRGVWDKLKFTLAGSQLTLGEIEHQILRKKFQDPRVHFVLVCASIGCPELSPEAYQADKIYRQLEERTREFINNPEKVFLDKKRNVLYISSIFKWFAKDFGDLPSFIYRYLNSEDKEFFKTNKPKIKYLKYDWSLNDLP